MSNENTFPMEFTILFVHKEEEKKEEKKEKEKNNKDPGVMVFA